MPYFMIRKFVSVSLLGLFGGVGGCRPGESLAPIRVRSTEESARDREIFDAALPDLIDNEDFSPATGGSAVKKRQVVVDDATYGGVSAHFVERSGLNLAQAVRTQLGNDLLRRNPSGTRFPIALYQPANHNIVVRKLTHNDLDIEFADRFPDARGFLQLLLPGFSEDGQTAIFAFWFGPSPHGAFGAYILGQENGRWSIRQRAFGYQN
jgi:hypothetical protein